MQSQTSFADGPSGTRFGIVRLADSLYKARFRLAGRVSEVRVPVSKPYSLLRRCLRSYTHSTGPEKKQLPRESCQYW